MEKVYTPTDVIVFLGAALFLASLYPVMRLVNELPPGEETINGVKVRRFAVARALRIHQLDRMSLEHGRERGRLRKVQILGVLIKVSLRGRLNAVGVGAVRNLVQVEVQNLVMEECRVVARM